MLIETSIGLFIVTAAIGSSLAVRARRGSPRSPRLLLAHGAGAMAGIIALSLSVVPIMGRYDTGLKGMALGLFLLAAGIGVSAFITREEDEPIRWQPLIAHAGLATIALALLIAGTVLNK